MVKLELPKIGFGVYQISGQQTAKVVYGALAAGYRLIDTAQLYGNERETAQGIRDFVRDHPDVPRSSIIYTSKIWDSDFGYDAAKDAIADSFARACEPIDLYLMHSSGDGRSERLDTWKALEDAVEEGKLRHIGVSNWGVHHLEELLSWPELRIKPVVNQIEVNPWKRMDDLVHYCHSKGIAVEGYSPLSLGQKLNDPELLALAAKYKKSPAQVLLCWIIQHGVIPLPKSTHMDRAKENLGALDFHLTAEEELDLGDPQAYHMAIPGWDPTKWQ